MQRERKIIQVHDWKTAWESWVSGHRVFVFTCVGGRFSSVAREVEAEPCLSRLGKRGRMTISWGLKFRLEV